MKILEKVSKKELHDFLNYGMNLNDKSLYKELTESQQFIFQFSGETASDQIKKAEPDCFDDVVVINATSRPGASSMFPSFVEAKKYGTKKYPPQLDKILGDSRGCITFQEQIMNAFALCAGYDPKKTNRIRGLLKKLGKAKKAQADLDEWNNVHVPAFKEGCIKMGMKSSEVDMVIKDIVALSAYSFNKSHAYAYSYIAMITVYLSKYFRNYYYAASLTYDASKKDVLKESIQKVEGRGYKIVPPDINTSDLHFYPVGQKINFGLNEIKGVGEQPAKDAIANRPYSSIIDFICKNIGNSINKRITNALVCGGAFDSLIGDKRKYYQQVVEKFYEKKKTTKIIPLLEEKWEDSLHEVQDCNTESADYISYEEQYLGGQFFHNKFTAIADKIEKLYSKGYCLRDFDEIRKKNLPKQYCFVYVNSYRYHIDKNGNDMIFMELEDRNGEKQSVPVFASYWKYCKEKFFAEDFYLMDLYSTEDKKIMFGSRNWVRDPNTIKNMIARVPR